MNLVLERAIRPDVNWHTAEGGRLRQTLRNKIPHHDTCRTQEMCACCSCQTHGPCSCNVDNGTGFDARLNAAMEACREDVRQQGEILHFCHGSIPVRKLQEVEICVWYHHILRLAPDPTSHVYITVGCTGACRVHVQANTSVATLTCSTTATGNVERHGTHIPLFDKFNVAAAFDHLARDFVAEHHVTTCEARAAPHHVLIGATNVRADDLQDHAMITFARLAFRHDR
mmetsp:Transcript_90169/g.179395  ORF Transcript_90169/g.179395 Transcript_90169/m.179395 type:complete len:228 (-) Transcript_90169:340-1023(-)